MINESDNESILNELKRVSNIRARSIRDLAAIRTQMSDVKRNLTAAEAVVMKFKKCASNLTDLEDDTINILAGLERTQKLLRSLQIQGPQSDGPSF